MSSSKREYFYLFTFGTIICLPPLPGFRDFPPECGATRRQHRTAAAKAETVSALVRRAGAWLDSQAGSKRLVSMEVLDHRLNYDMYHDTPTPGEKASFSTVSYVATYGR